MIKVKSFAVCAVLFCAIIGALIFLAESTVTPSSAQLDILNAQAQNIVRSQLLGAEESLIRQAHDLAGDAKFSGELAAVREKLLSSTPSELKQQTKNTWNSGVFDSLLSWRENRNAAIVRNKTNSSSALREDVGSMGTQLPIDDWWQKAPNLALAFAAIPMKTGELSATLIANASKGKELVGGKRYDEDIASLRRVIETQKAEFDLFAWDGKMYFARISPIFGGGNLIGLSVIGMELSKDLPAALEEALPESIKILAVYSSPKLGTPGKRVIYAADDETKTNAEIGRYAANDGDAAVRFDELSAGKIYKKVNAKGSDCLLSRFVWAWNGNAQTDIYAYIDIDQTKTKARHIETFILIIGIVGFIFAAILIWATIRTGEKRIQYIRRGFADALRSGSAIDGEVLSAIMGENAEALGEVNVIRQTVPDSESQDEDEDWSNLMMDFDDASNEKSDKEMTAEDIERVKRDSDMREAEALYGEYMAQRKANRIDAPMDFDCFVRRLHRNVVKIKETYGCDEVHFEVHASDGNVLLKPKIVKKSHE